MNWFTLSLGTKRPPPEKARWEPQVCGQRERVLLTPARASQRARLRRETGK